MQVSSSNGSHDFPLYIRCWQRRKQTCSEQDHHRFITTVFVFEFRQPLRRMGALRKDSCVDHVPKMQERTQDMSVAKENQTNRFRHAMQPE
jgi:hypothetical protein